MRIEWVFIWDSAAGSEIELKNPEHKLNPNEFSSSLDLIVPTFRTYKYRKDSGEQRIQSVI